MHQMDQKLLSYLMFMTVSIGIQMKMVCGYFRKDILCELLGIFTLVHVNKNFSDERSFHFCGFSYLFTTYVASWLATVLSDSVWGFNGMFTDYHGTLLVSKQLGPSLCRREGAQERPIVTRVWRVGSQSLDTRCSCESSAS